MRVGMLCPLYFLESARDPVRKPRVLPNSHLLSGGKKADRKGLKNLHKIQYVCSAIRRGSCSTGRYICVGFNLASTSNSETGSTD